MTFYSSLDINLLTPIKQVHQWWFFPLYCVDCQYIGAVMPLFQRGHITCPQRYFTSTFWAVLSDTWGQGTEFIEQSLHLTWRCFTCGFETVKKQRAQQIKAELVYPGHLLSLKTHGGGHGSSEIYWFCNRSMGAQQRKSKAQVARKWR